MKLVMVGLLAACGGGDGQSCKADAYELEQYLTTMDRGGGVFQHEAKLVTRDDLAKLVPVDQPVVDVAGSRVVYQGLMVSSEQLGEKLRAARARAADAIEQGRFPRDHPPDPARVLISIDGATPFSTVVAVVEAAHAAGLDRATFAFARTPTSKPPPRSKVDDELDRIQAGSDAASSVTALAELTKKVIEPCPQVRAAFGRVAATDGNREDALVHAIGPALVECNCAADVASLRSVLWRMIGNPDPLSQLEVRLDSAAKPLELPATATWSDASKQLAKSATSAWFVVKAR